MSEEKASIIREHLLNPKIRQELLTTLVGQLPFVIYSIDADGYFTFSEGMGLERLGLKPGEAVGQSVFEMYKDNPDVLHYIKSTLEGNEESYETTVNGVVYTNIHTPLYDEEGNVSGMTGVSFDVTDQKRAQEVIKRSESRFKTLFNSAGDAIFLMDHQVFIDCNPATLKIFGCAQGDIVGQTPYRFSPSHQPDGESSEVKAKYYINEALEGRPQFFEWRHIRLDGTPFDAEVSLNRLDVGGEVLIQAIVRDITERKQVEEENKLLALVANHTTNMVVVADGKGKIQWVNQGFTKITGYTLEEVQGKSPGSILQGPASDPKVVRFMHDQVVHEKGFKDVEIINYHKDGTPYWVSIEVQPIRNKQGKVFQYIAIESDVTEKKETQLALMEREQKFRNLVNQSPLGVIEWDLDFRVREWNRAAEKIFGYTREEALGRLATDLILDDDLVPLIENVWDAVVRQTGGSHNRNKNKRKDGVHIMCEWYNSPLINKEGKTTGVVSMVEDISYRLKAEKALKESELRFRQIVQSSPMGIFMFESDKEDHLVLIEANDAAEKMLKKGGESRVGLVLEKAFPEWESAGLLQNLRKVAGLGTPSFLREITFNGQVIQGTFQVTAFQAGYRRVAVMLLDITAKRRAEEALKNKNKELMKINAELDRFVYSASHDLRAPIASLLGLIRVIRMEKERKQQMTLLDLQEKSLQRLDQFIQEIVNYSRNSRLELKPEPVDFDQELKDTVEHLHFMENMKRIRTHIVVEQEVPFKTDIGRLRVVLNNLISNGVKYADLHKEDPYLDIRVKANENEAEIIIEDNGEGIA